MPTPQNSPASKLVPGIEKYPDLEQRFDKERAGLKHGCNTCEWGDLLNQFKERVKGREQTAGLTRRISRKA